MKKLLIALVFVIACDDKKVSPQPDPTPPVVTAASSVATAAPPPPAASKPEAAPDAISAQHVLVAYKGAKNAPKSVTRTKAEAQARAAEVVKAARASDADFTALVKQYSDDEGTKDRQGSLGKFARDKMVKPFSDAAFALKVNEVSDAVETPFGFHVIKRNQ